MKTQVPVSQLHFAIANLAQYLETNADTTLWGFCDEGSTLEIDSAILAGVREDPNWQALEQAYEAVDGSIYSPDESDWS